MAPFTALVVFAVMAIAYRCDHPQGSVGFHLSNGTPVNYNVDQVNVLDDKNQPVQHSWADGSPKNQQDANGNAIVLTSSTRREEAGAHRRGCRPRRWVVERTHSWFNRFRKLLVSFEKSERSYLGLTSLAAALICWRQTLFIYG